MRKHAIGQIIPGWLRASPTRVRGQAHSHKAVYLSAHNPQELTRAAHLLTRGTVGVIAFNGVYGIFASVASQEAGKRILAIKERPEEKKLVMVTAPEYLAEQVDFSKAHYSHEQIVSLVHSVHALGVILPAKRNALRHLIATADTTPTILSIWTEYPPLRQLLEQFRQLGGQALAGTSANKSGHPTHVETNAVWQDFKTEVDFFVAADFSHLPTQRKRSTSILDLTASRPRLHRLGNVSQEEIQEALCKYRFPDMQVARDHLILVHPRTEKKNTHAGEQIPAPKKY